MRFAPLFGRFCPIFLHLVQELTPNFGDSRNKFCNIFVTILPHLFHFGETSFYGGKKCRFSSFSGRGRCPCPGSECFRFRDPEVLPQTEQLLCPTSPSSLRDATSPSRGGFGRPPRSWQTFLHSRTRGLTKAPLGLLLRHFVPPPCSSPAWPINKKHPQTRVFLFMGQAGLEPATKRL